MNIQSPLLLDNNNLLAQRQIGKPLITLNMICKHEEELIGACLNSLKPYIDQWVIAIDSKSQDRTRDIILEVLADIPGKLYTHEWYDFSTNRNMALACAEQHSQAGDYIFIMDADDQAVFSTNFQWQLNPNISMYWTNLYSYQSLDNQGDALIFQRPFLVRCGDGWRYKYRIHEHLHHDNAGSMPQGVVEHMHIIHRQAGTRSKIAARYLHDAYLLEQDLLTYPDDPRAMFYLAQSYYSFGLSETALNRYQRRYAIESGYQDERYISLYRIAEISKSLGKPWPEVKELFLKAWQFDPTRAEPIYQIVKYYSALQKHDQLICLYAEQAVNLPCSNALFIEQDVYRYLLKDIYAVALFWCGQYEKSLAINEQLLIEGYLPEAERSRIKQNLHFCLERLGRSIDDYQLPSKDYSKKKI